MQCTVWKTESSGLAKHLLPQKQAYVPLKDLCWPFGKGLIPFQLRIFA